jgi:ABC-type transport system involved in multi-copper enzyme maturation permease subunit
MKQQINPIIVNEMRTRMRGCRAYVILTVYLIVISCTTGSMYTSMYEDSNSQNSLYNVTTPDIQSAPSVGKAIFTGTTFLLLILISHIAPAFTAAAISGERERQTYEILSVTPLAARQIVWGKLGAVFWFLLLLILTSLPVQSLAFLFGGVALTELIIASIVLMVTALAFGAFGLYISSLNRTTMVSIIFTYSITLPFIYGLPFMVLFLFSFFFPFVVLLGSQSSELLAIVYTFLMIYIGGFLLSINPFSSAILTMLVAANGKGYFFFTEQINYQWTVPLVSPWIIYVTFGILMTLLLTFLTSRRISQISNF